MATLRKPPLIKYRLDFGKALGGSLLPAAVTPVVNYFIKVPCLPACRVEFRIVQTRWRRGVNGGGCCAAGSPRGRQEAQPRPAGRLGGESDLQAAAGPGARGQAPDAHNKAAS